MRPKLLLMLVLSLVVSVPGCGLFATKEHIVFVREDLNLDQAPRQILKTTEDVRVDVVYYNGESWILARNAVIPAGWLIVSPAVEETVVPPEN